MSLTWSTRADGDASLMDRDRNQDWQQWQAAKRASREADERALAAGEKSREQLARENGISARIAQAPLSQDAWDSVFKS